MRYLRIEKLRSFHLRPFIVSTQAKRAHYKAEKETTCSVNVLTLVSPNPPDLLQLWGQSTSKPNALSLRERWFRGEVVPHTHIYTTQLTPYKWNLKTHGGR